MQTARKTICPIFDEIIESKFGNQLNKLNKLINNILNNVNK